LPNLYVVPVCRLLCRFNRRGIVSTIEVCGALEMAIRADQIGPVTGHADASDLPRSCGRYRNPRKIEINWGLYVRYPTIAG
jgi:hypothetical protein